MMPRGETQGGRPGGDRAPRRILIVTYEYPPLGGGTGKAARCTALELRRMGYEAAVLTSRFGDQPRDERDDGLQIHRIPVLRRHRNYANALEVISFGISGLVSGGRFVREFAPDLILAYHGLPSGLPAMRWARRGIPYLTLLRGQDVPGHPETRGVLHRIALPVTRRVWRRAYRVVANSGALADLARKAAPELDVAIAPNGIDLTRYGPASAEVADDGGPVRIIYTGRLVPIKRLDVLIEAFAAARGRTGRPMELRLAGHGPERPSLERLAQKLGVSESVRFLGVLGEAEVIEALRGADIAVNLSDFEGLPNAVLEALACAKPVVLSDLEPHRDVIETDRAGIICERIETGHVTRALVELANSPELRRRMGAAGREIVETRFAWPRAVESLAAHFPWNH